MGFQIRVQPSGQVFQSGSDETILEAALRQGVMLPYGCRDGLCGACRGKVLSGQVDHGRASIHTLDDAEREEGFALFCCAHAQSDVVIEGRLPVAAPCAQVKTLPVRVEKLVRVAPDVMLMELRMPPHQWLHQAAGQYIEILLPEGRRRAFSLANPPSEEGCLQLHIRRVPGGQFTGQVFETLKERDMLRISGPHGGFFLREQSTKPMLLVAGGTGFAPIKAIVEQLIAEKSTRPMTLYWGGRTRADLYFLELAEHWAQTQANIRFVPVLSEAAPGDHWCGRTGLVHAAAVRDFPDLSGYQVYVCGSPAMVSVSRTDFVGQCGLPENEFIADSFEFANDNATAESGASITAG